MSATTKSFDVHCQVTEQIIAAIEAGAEECRMPWHRLHAANAVPTNAVTKASYRGINVLALWASCMLHVYPYSLWASYKQWQQIGAQVRKGERGTCVVFYKEYQVDPDSNDDDGLRRVARASWIFNCSQVDGFEPPSIPECSPVERIAAADRIIGSSQADIRHGGDQAYYHPKEDYIQMPDERLFAATDETRRSEDYYAVLLHELVHWTGHDKRLNRILGKPFVDATYAKEELVAELGAAFLCAETGISNEPRPEHADYIDHWLTLLENDKRAIFTAASLASRAVDYIKDCPE